MPMLQSVCSFEKRANDSLFSLLNNFSASVITWTILVTKVTIFLLAPTNLKSVEVKFHRCGVKRSYKVTKSHIFVFFGYILFLGNSVFVLFLAKNSNFFTFYCFNWK